MMYWKEAHVVKTWNMRATASEAEARSPTSRTSLTGLPLSMWVSMEADSPSSVKPWDWLQPQLKTWLQMKDPELEASR